MGLREQEDVEIQARLARIAGYSPSVGDEVLVARNGESFVVVAVLEAAFPIGMVVPEIIAPDGARAALVDGAIEVRDTRGRLLVRYVDGTAEVSPVTGDLRLSAPQGHVHIEAGLDVAIAARRDVTVAGDRAAELRGGPAEGDLASCVRAEASGATLVGERLELRAREARLTAADAAVVARDVRTRATRVETVAARVETTADHVATRAKSLVQEVTGLLETKVGRVRTLVRGAFSLRSRSTSMKSQEDTSVDGRRVLLG